MIMGVTAAKTFRRRQGQVDQDAKAKPFYNIEWIIPVVESQKEPTSDFTLDSSGATG